MIGLRTFVAAAALALPVAAFGEAHGDPWCDDLEMGEGGVDCALPAGDLILFFDFEDFEVTISQTTPEGGDTLTLDAFDADDRTHPPVLNDVTGDGVPELFVARGSGMVNVDYVVLQAGEDGYYRPIGSIFGGMAQGFEQDENGLIVTATRDNAAVYVESALAIADGAINSVYDMEVDYAAQSCRLLFSGDLAALGLDAETLVATCEDREW